MATYGSYESSRQTQQGSNPNGLPMMREWLLYQCAEFLRQILAYLSGGSATAYTITTISVAFGGTASQSIPVSKGMNIQTSDDFAGTLNGVPLNPATSYQIPYSSGYAAMDLVATAGSASGYYIS